MSRKLVSINADGSKTYRQANPLDDFRSYSTNFVMIACLNQIVLKDFFATLYSNEEYATDISALSSLKIGEPVFKDKSPADNGIVIVNSFIDSEYIIDNVQFSGGVDTYDYAESKFLNCSFTIKEPVTANFFNFMNSVRREFGVGNLQNIVFVLVPIFTGVTFDNVIKTVDIVPIPLQPTEIKASFTEGGGQYDINCNGLERIAKSNAYGRISFTPPTVSDGTLGSAITHLEKCLNDTSNADYDKQVKSASENNVAPPARKLKYVITIPPEWKDFSINTQNVDNHTETEKVSSKNKKAAPKAKPIGNQTIVHDVASDIKDCLMKILNFCPDYKKLATKENTNVKYDYAVTATISTNFISSKDSGTVYYNLFPSINYAGIDGARLDGRADVALEFDYVFSGKNEDIVSFDLKIDDGMLLLVDQKPVHSQPSDPTKSSTANATKASQKTVDETKDASSKQVNKGGVNEVDATDPNNNIQQISKTPLGSVTRGLSYNSEDVKAELAFKAALAAKSTTDATINLQIRGNPVFLRQMDYSKNFKTDDEYVAYIETAYQIFDRYLISSPDQQQQSFTDEELLIITDKANNLFKINIFSPRSSSFTDASTVKLDPFYYSGYYMLKEVGSSINGGTFEQTLTGFKMDMTKQINVQNGENTQADMVKE